MASGRCNVALKNGNSQWNPALKLTCSVVAEIAKKLGFQKSRGHASKKALRAPSSAPQRSSRSNENRAQNRWFHLALGFKSNRHNKWNAVAQNIAKMFAFQKRRGHATRNTSHWPSLAPQRASKSDERRRWNRWFLSMINLKKQTSQKLRTTNN